MRTETKRKKKPSTDWLEDKSTQMSQKAQQKDKEEKIRKEGGKIRCHVHESLRSHKGVLHRETDRQSQII